MLVRSKNFFECVFKVQKEFWFFYIEPFLYTILVHLLQPVNHFLPDFFHFVFKPLTDLHYLYPAFLIYIWFILYIVFFANCDGDQVPYIGWRDSGIAYKFCSGNARYKPTVVPHKVSENYMVCDGMFCSDTDFTYNLHAASVFWFCFIEVCLSLIYKPVFGLTIAVISAFLHALMLIKLWLRQLKEWENLSYERQFTEPFFKEINDIRWLL